MGPTISTTATENFAQPGSRLNLFHLIFTSPQVIAVIADNKIIKSTKLFLSCAAHYTTNYVPPPRRQPPSLEALSLSAGRRLSEIVGSAVSNTDQEKLVESECRAPSNRWGLTGRRRATVAQSLTFRASIGRFACTSGVLVATTTAVVRKKALGESHSQQLGQSRALDLESEEGRLS